MSAVQNPDRTTRPTTVSLVLLALIVVIVGIWFFDPFDNCRSEWRETTYQDFSGQVTETCVIP